MKIFCDSADYQNFLKYNKDKLVKGFTTNPSLMRQSGAKNYKSYAIKLLRNSNFIRSFFRQIRRNVSTG